MDFLSTFAPEAQRIAPLLGVSPDSILGHWGQETGWGDHLHGFNVGNITAGSNYGGASEVRGDTDANNNPITQRFRVYSSPQEAADDYANNVMSSRYSAARNTGQDAQAFGAGLLGGKWMTYKGAPQAIAQAASMVANGTAPSTNISDQGQGPSAGAPKGQAPSQGPSGGPVPPPPASGSGPYSPTSLPPMPANFGQPTQGPSPVAQAQQATPGGALISMGLAMMGGNGWHDAMAKGGAAFEKQQALEQQLNTTNAGLQNDAINRDALAPGQAATAAANRAQAWSLMNDRITPYQAATLNNASRLGDIQLYDAQEKNAATVEAAKQRAMLQQYLTKGAPQQFVVPGATPDQDTIWEGTKDGSGTFSYTNTSTGQAQPTLPQGAVPQALYNQRQHHADAQEMASGKIEGQILSDGTAAQGKLNDLDRVEADLAKPGVNAGPGIVANVGRAIDGVAGTSLFSNLTDQQTANLDLKGLNWQNIRQSTQGTGRLMANEINMLSKYAPTIDTDPAARQQFFNVLRNAASRQQQVSQRWLAMSDPERKAIKSSGTMNVWLAQQNSDIYNQQSAAQQSRAPAIVTPNSMTPNTAGGPGSARPPLASFSASSAPPAPEAAPDPSAAVLNVP